MAKKKVGSAAPAEEIRDVQEVAEKKDRRVVMPMSEYGSSLPIGILVGDTLNKTLEIKKWRTKEERVLGEKLSQTANMPDHIGIVVSNMCSRIGPNILDESVSDDQKSLMIKTMYVGDVFYIYAYLRRQVMGNKLKVNITCPRVGCDVEFPFVGSLDSVDVTTASVPDDILWTYTLEDPIKIRGKDVTHFQATYPKWSIMSQSVGMNETEIKIEVIKSSVVGINDDIDPLILIDAEVDELSKPDLEGLVEEVTKTALGPKMSIEGKCEPSVCTRFKKGGHKFSFPIEWRYKDFFAPSSR